MCQEASDGAHPGPAGQRGHAAQAEGDERSPSTMSSIVSSPGGAWAVLLLWVRAAPLDRWLLFVADWRASHAPAGVPRGRGPTELDGLQGGIMMSKRLRIVGKGEKKMKIAARDSDTVGRQGP